ncbi:MAG: hypothetical protein [Sanya fiers-like virus 20]|nr:MAG: hypothetical protein [Sanya fiers-like virus 20]
MSAVTYGYVFNDDPLALVHRLDCECDRCRFVQEADGSLISLVMGGPLLTDYATLWSSVPHEDAVMLDSDDGYGYLTHSVGTFVLHLASHCSGSPDLDKLAEERQNE